MNWVSNRLLPATRTARLRVLVVVVALAATGFKLLFAASTFGTNDVHSWLSFAQGVRDFGPVDLYGHTFFTLYNHPPMSGRMLVAINWLVDHGVSNLVFLIKVPACLADAGTALLVFELIRRWRPATEAAAAAMMVVCSPALFVISGFHGNTDPVFVMFTLLSVYLLVVRRWSAAAGVSFAVAISIKLVPIVLVLMLLVVLVRLGWRRLATFGIGSLAVFVPLWGPVVLRRWPEFKQDVLGYGGVWAREWGLTQLASWTHAPASWTEAFVGPGRFIILVLSATAAAVLVWRHPARFGPAVGLALALFLLFSPAFSMQYLIWPLAAAYLINTWAATVYNLAASALILVVYSNWNQAPPWRWYEGVAVLFRPVDFVLMVVTWVALAVVTVIGVTMIWRRGPDLTAVTDAESVATGADARPTGDQVIEPAAAPISSRRVRPPGFRARRAAGGSFVPDSVTS